MASSVQVSVVICTRDRPHFIGSAVSSVLCQSYSACQVVVIDQSATDSSWREIQNIRLPSMGSLVYHRTPSRGLSRARNIGLGMCSGAIVAFTDDDVIADEHWVGRLSEEYERHPDVGLVFGRVLPLEEDGRGGTFCVTASEEERVYTGNCSVPYGVGGGNNMSVRKSVVERMGAFDERLGAGGLFPGAEDIDFIFRAFIGGFKVLYSPRPLVYHRQWREARDLTRATRDYNRASAAFIAKHLLAGSPGILRVLRYRLWHHALSSTFSGIRRVDWNRVAAGLAALHDHLKGGFAFLQR